MQKVLRRTALAKAQAKRKARIQAEFDHKSEVSAFRDAKIGANRERSQAIKDERLRRREDWELGSLSPWRNRFESLLQSPTFGSWHIRQNTLAPKPKRDRVKDLMIRKDDRIVVVEGHETIKGHIGKVTDVDEEQETLRVEGINLVDLEFPPQFGEKEETQSTNLPLPYDSVRLVYPLPDPETGIPRDVVIGRLVARQRKFDIYENKETFERWLEPQHIRIPWPEKKEPNYIDEEMDTLRIDTEQQSFLPTLLRPPMPFGVVDEMRNKYSKFRDRHDDDFIAKKEAEDRIEEIEKMRKQAVAPRGARNIARSRKGTLKRAKGEPLLSDELAAHIGERMAIGEAR